MPDELHQPLGLQRPGEASGASTSRAGRWPSAWTLTYAGLGVLAAAAGYYAARYGDPNGGYPRVVAKIEQLAPAPAAPQTQADRDAETTGSIARRGAGPQSPDEIERNSGVKVTRTGGAGAPGALIIQLDAPAGVRLAPAPDARLVERGRLGNLPKVGADGARAWQVYARPLALSQKLKGDAPRIALLVGGLGLSPTTTQAAMEKLPADVSFAFAPYGSDVATQAAGARDAGHEIFLQAPMEPFDYPQNNPGPHTLMVKASPDEATSDLHWLMSRFPGYVGVVNFLGARFMSTQDAIAPFMRELAARGVGFVDDGSSPQSLAAGVGANVGAAVARADMVLDADAKPEAIETQLSKLEQIARQKGFALGVASAIPGSIDKLSRFAKGLENRGIALVPASVALGREREPQAEARRP
ncbi:MAG: divergent polysaccharide deacetylase family protein [Beijerinckiaceae bacterium]